MMADEQFVSGDQMAAIADGIDQRFRRLEAQVFGRNSGALRLSTMATPMNDTDRARYQAIRSVMTCGTVQLAKVCAELGVRAPNSPAQRHEAPDGHEGAVGWPAVNGEGG